MSCTGFQIHQDMQQHAEFISISRGRQAIDWFRSDGRHFQIVSLLLFLAYGITFLGWDANGYSYLAALGGCLAVQGLAILYGGLPASSMKSAIITVLGLSLLFKANDPWLFFFAGMLAISQKFALRVHGKHLWNPANFGIITVMLLTGQGWVSPGQWGTSALLIFIIGSMGLGVLSKVRRLDTGLIFVASYAALEYARTILYLGWGHEVWLHKLAGGAFWLFALFMITDPMTSPCNKKVRVVWVIAVATISFYLANFHFINAAPLWVLFFATPIVPFIDRLAGAKAFQWQTNTTISISNH